MLSYPLGEKVTDSHQNRVFLYIFLDIPFCIKHLKRVGNLSFESIKFISALCTSIKSVISFLIFDIAKL
jgi:hypothetical protein